MSIQATARIRRISGWLCAIILFISILLALLKHFDAPARTGRHIYIAFGFHVNLYHSFRGDANDDNGVGKDIRIIRHIISTLDHFNAMGVPVKGVWDFDNLFSLQELLPRYAPDIITDIRRRIEENGDEVILMSYNNGLASAMTAAELEDSVRWSITNPWQSGVKDLFGSYTPIVRPQEMMTTPGTFSIYKKYGIQAVSLYYSATPFDAFRVFSRPLSRLEAHNPVLYRHPETGEEMVVIPTYHIGDLAEHVSLDNWAGELHKLQETGKLDGDALIFVNFDADSELWSGLDLSPLLSWLPSTSGLEGFVSEVRDHPYIRFTTVGDYLSDHSPVGSFYFSQDTADGSFNGYSSWAEKASTNRNWTIIEQSRRVCSAAQKAVAFLEGAMDTNQLENLLAFSYMKRLRALSTTHFGMSTPYLSRQRERDTNSFMDGLDNDSQAIEGLMTESFRRYLEQHPLPPEIKTGDYLDTLLVLTSDRTEKTGGGRFLKVPTPGGYETGMGLRLVSSGGKELAVRNLGPAQSTGTDALLLAVDEPSALADGIYHLYRKTAPLASAGTSGDPVTADLSGISNGRLSIRFETGGIEGIYLDGVRVADAGSLTPSFKWKGSLFQAPAEALPPVTAADNGSVSCRMTGTFPGPSGQTLSDGWMYYRLTLPTGLPYLILQGSLHYPATERLDTYKAASSDMIHQTDLGWQEVSPARLLYSPAASRENPVRVLKRNYLGISSDYRLDYFRFSDRNLNLDSINNQITESYVGLVAGGAGVGISTDNSEQANFAFSPLKMRYDAKSAALTIHANPFGTYYGRQLSPPTWGNGNGFELTLLTGEQFESAAPAYNGASEHFNLLFAFFPSEQMPEEIERDLIGFANPPVVISATSPSPAPSSLPSPDPPEGFVASYHEGAVQFSWEGDGESDLHYRILCGIEPGVYETVYPAVGNTLKVTGYAEGLPFVEGKRYYAVIESVAGTGRISDPSPEIGFTIRHPRETSSRVPVTLSIRLFWASLLAWFEASIQGGF